MLPEAHDYLQQEHLSYTYVTQTYVFMPFSSMKLLFLHCSRRPLPASPTLPEAEVPPDPTFSLPLLSLSLLPSFLLTPFPRLPPSIPSPDTHPLQTEVRVQVLAAPAAPSQTKVFFRDPESCYSYLRDNSRWCHSLPGVSIQSDTFKKVPSRNQAGKIFKKKQLGENCLSFSHSFSILSFSSDSKW